MQKEGRRNKEDKSFESVTLEISAQYHAGTKINKPCLLIKETLNSVQNSKDRLSRETNCERKYMQ